jgi:hypothetical protein
VHNDRQNYTQPKENQKETDRKSSVTFIPFHSIPTFFFDETGGKFPYWFYSNLERPAVIAPIIPTALRNIKTNSLRINTGAVRFTTTAPLVPVGIIKNVLASGLKQTAKHRDGS